jgi:hypothetical protein
MAERPWTAVALLPLVALDVRSRGEGPVLAAAGLPVLYSDGKLLAVGPCSPPTGSP